MPDIQVGPIAEVLLTCLSEAVSANPNPPLNICYRVGAEAAHDADFFTDLCCEGLAYVTLLDMYPSSESFPNADIVRQASAVCAPAAWAINMRMGIVRCSPVGTDESMPTCADWNAAFTQTLDDSQALRRASCCFRSQVLQLPGMEGMSVVIGEQSQSGPEGGCMERFQTVQVQIINCDCGETV